MALERLANLSDGVTEDHNSRKGSKNVCAFGPALCNSAAVLKRD